uniref:Uncharacterized protein n=1 Tax=viral metagenome TaxID=1070528 RepID=A0A2V0RNM2_9ZZZZ
MNNNDIILGMILAASEANRMAKMSAGEIVSNMTTEEFTALCADRFKYRENVGEMEKELETLRNLLFNNSARECLVSIPPSVYTLAEKARCAATYAHHEYTDMVEVIHDGVLYQEHSCDCGYSVIQAFNVNSSGKITGPYQYDFTEEFMRALPQREQIKHSEIAHTDDMTLGVHMPAKPHDMDLEGGPF